MGDLLSELHGLWLALYVLTGVYTDFAQNQEDDDGGLFVGINSRLFP